MFSKRSFPSRFQTKMLYAFIISPLRATCSAHSILIDVINLITFLDEYKL
jgi:hypothetical protein